MRKPSIKQSAIRPPADQNPWGRGEQPWRTPSEQSRTEVQAAKGLRSSHSVGGGPPFAAFRMKCSTEGRKDGRISLTLRPSNGGTKRLPKRFIGGFVPYASEGGRPTPFCRAAYETQSPTSRRRQVGVHMDEGDLDTFMRLTAN